MFHRNDSDKKTIQNSGLNLKCKSGVQFIYFLMGFKLFLCSIEFGWSQILHLSLRLGNSFGKHNEFIGTERVTHERLVCSMKVRTESTPVLTSIVISQPSCNNHVLPNGHSWGLLDSDRGLHGSMGALEALKCDFLVNIVYILLTVINSFLVLDVTP